MSKKMREEGRKDQEQDQKEDERKPEKNMKGKMKRKMRGKLKGIVSCVAKGLSHLFCGTNSLHLSHLFAYLLLHLLPRQGFA